jgi:hypothetical protein
MWDLVGNCLSNILDLLSGRSVQVSDLNVWCVRYELCENMLNSGDVIEEWGVENGISINCTILSFLSSQPCSILC